jgi:quercetin dioxygenase-like cupin family protein
MGTKMKALFVIGGILVPVIAIATPASGILSNVFPSKGTTLDLLQEDFTVRAGMEDGEDWALTLQTSGEADFYSQEIVIGPGGYSGWHNHPGLLLITVKEGTIDWYDRNCVKHVYTAGQSLTESNQAHNIVNSGTVNTRLFGWYIIKAGAARRIEDPQPACAVPLGLP